MKQTLPEQIYPWHQNVWETLTTRFPNIGHGLLFYGKKGCGKETLAEQFLARVLFYEFIHPFSCRRDSRFCSRRILKK